MAFLAVLGVLPGEQNPLGEPAPLDLPVLPDGEGRVFYAGLQKAGSTTFAAFTSALGLRTVHGFGYGFYRSNQSCLEGAVGPTAHNGWQPDYEAVLREVGAARVREMLLKGEVQAAADTAWPLLFKFIAKLLPKAKFVLWPRPAAKWVHSFTHFFGGREPCRHTMHSYGAPSYSALNTSAASRAKLGRVWEAHIDAVKGHFAVSPERLLLLDFEADDAGRKLCQFVLGASATRCANFTSLPTASPTWVGFDTLHAVARSSPEFRDGAFGPACWVCPHGMDLGMELATLEYGEPPNGPCPHKNRSWGA